MTILPAKAQHWDPDFKHSFEDFMAITVNIKLNGTDVTRPGTEAASFIDGELRGAYTVEPMDILGGKYVFYLPIWGASADNDKPVVVRFYDPDTDMEYEITMPIVYEYMEIPVETFVAPLDNTMICYKITVDPLTGGTVTPSPPRAKSGTAVSLTVAAAAHYTFESISVKAGGLAVALSGTGNNRSFTMPAKDVTVSATFSNPGLAAIEKVKGLIEAGTYTIAQAEVSTDGALKTWLAGQINALTGMDATGINVAASAITITSKISSTDPTVAVDDGTISSTGTDGSFNFTVSLTGGGSTLTAIKTDNTITHNPPPATYTVNTDGPYTHGNVTATPSDPVVEGSSITLAATPAFGYELNAIKVYKTGEPAIIYSNSLTFSMPAYNVTAGVTFMETADQQVLNTVKSAIEGVGTYIIDQSVANTIEDVKDELVIRINAILSGGTSIMADNITIETADFTAASEGTADTPSGTNGGFIFSVSLTATNGNATAVRSGTITATPFVSAATPIINTHPQSAIYNDGASATDLGVRATSPDGGALTYQWYSNTENNTAGSEPIGGEINPYYTPQTIVEGTTYYYVVVKNTKESTFATATSQIVAIEVTAASLIHAETPSIDTQPQGATPVNADEPVSLTVAASVTDGGTLSYQWYDNGAANSNIGGNPVGTNSASYSPSTATAGTKYYYVEVTNTNTSVNGTKIAKVKSKTATVTVNAIVNAQRPVINTHPQGATYIESATATALTVTASSPDGGVLSYQWYSNDTPDEITPTPVGTDASYMPLTTATGTLYYYAVVTNTNAGVNGTSTATATSAIATVTVTATGITHAETPVIINQPQNAPTVNEGGSIAPLSVTATVGDGGTLSYQWYENATVNSNIGGNPVGTNSDGYSPPTATAGTKYYYVEVTNTKNGIDGTPTVTVKSNTATVTVNAVVNAQAPAINSQPQGATYSQDATATPLTVTATSPDGGILSYQWYSNDTPDEDTPSPIGSNTATYTPPTTTEGTVYYYVRVTNANTTVNGTSTATATSTIAAVTVTAASITHAATPNITTQPTATPVNAGVSVTLTVAASVTDGGTLSYRWYENATVNSNSGGNQVGTNSASYSPPTAAAGTKYYYVEVTNTKNGINGTPTVTVKSNTATVTVNAVVDAQAPVINLHPQGATYNQSATAAALTVTASSTDGGSLSYEWYRNTSNNTASGTLITDAINATYMTPSTNAQGTVYYYVRVTNTNTAVNGATTATATSAIAAVEVTAADLVHAATPNITTQPSATPVNEGDIVTLTVAASITDGGTGGALSYQWYDNGTVNSNAGGLPVVGEITDTYTPSTATAGTKYYYVEVTNINSTVTGTQTVTVRSNTATVTVNAIVDAQAPVINLHPQGATYNESTTAAAAALAVTATSPDGGSLSFQWYGNTLDNTAGGTPITGATSATYTPPTTAQGTVYYYVAVTNTRSGINGTPTATATSATAAVTVTSTSVTHAATPVITTEPQDAPTVNEGGSITPLSVTATITDDGAGGGVLSYRWYKNEANSNSGGTIIAGATNATYTPSAATAGTTYYYVVVKNTNETVNGVQTATVTSRPAKVRVIALVDAAPPFINIEPTGGTYTLNATATAITVSASSTDGGGLSYQWYRNTVNNTAGGTSVSGATSYSYTPPTTAAGTLYYYVEIKNTNDLVTGTRTATVKSAAATVTVNALVNAAAPTISVQPQGATYSRSATATPLTVTASSPDGGVLTYQWYGNTANNTASGSPIAGATGNSYTPPTTATGTVYYYAVITNTKSSVSGTPTATATSSIAAITVTSATTDAATPVITAQPQNAAVQVGDNVTLSVTASVGDGGTLSYRWYSSTANRNTGGSPVIGATGSSYSPPTATAGTVYYYAVVTNTNNSVNGSQTATATSGAATVTCGQIQSQTDIEAVAAAKTAIENGTYRVTQATANTDAAVKAWLLNTLRALFGQSSDVQLRAATTDALLTMVSFTPAIEGTETAPAGTNGSFRYTVTLTRGAATLTTAEITGVIIAMPHASTPVKAVELLQLGATTVRILNTGNIATGDLTLTITGSNAAVFALSTTVQGSLAAGSEADIILSVQAGLAAGTYTATLTATAEGMTPVSVTITYTVKPTGIDPLQSTLLKAWVSNGDLHVSGLVEGEVLSVYNMRGQLVYNGKATTAEQRINLRERGIYVVVSGNRRVKTAY
jgi:anti-sigma28 factor (negative regulator of flagellin synthesis)/lipopolysaccharide export LptBFGC system permease protein LptF